MKIDQVGISPGLPGFARKDGLYSSGLVTITDTTPGGTSLVEILWVDPADDSAMETLEPNQFDDHVWTFIPKYGVKGPIRIRLTHTDGDAVTTETRIFGIPDFDGFVPPAPGERSDPNAVRGNETNPLVIARCERNWTTSDNPAGNPFGWAQEVGRKLSAPIATRRFIDVRVATEVQLGDYTKLGGEQPEDQAIYTAEDNGALIVDGEELEVGDLLLLLWEPSARGACRVLATGDDSHPWQIMEVYEDKFANSESMFRASRGQEHVGRVFVRNTFDEYTESAPVLNPQIINGSFDCGPGMLFLVTPVDADDIVLTMRTLGGAPTRFHRWRIAVKLVDAFSDSPAMVRINTPDGQDIEVDNGQLDDHYEQSLPLGAYREWEFNATLSMWVMVGRFQPVVEG